MNGIVKMAFDCGCVIVEKISMDSVSNFISDSPIPPVEEPSKLVDILNNDILFMYPTRPIIVREMPMIAPMWVSTAMLIKEMNWSKIV